jgi:4-amino-4-deoxy-L-arabinose transferase-like glycosyltransferase
VPVVLLTLIGAFLRFFMIGHQGLWYDESFTALLVKFSPGKMLGLIPSQESTPPLFYCVEWVWSRIFGDTPAGLRSLSAVCGTITIPLAYFAAKKLLPSERAAIIVTALTAFNPLLIWYSQEARSYSMMVMFSAASLLAFAYARERPNVRRLVVWTVISFLALATHYYSGLIVLPEAGYLLYTNRREIRVWVAMAVLLAGGLALLPLLEAQTSSGNQNWIAGSALGRRLFQIIPLFLIGTGAPERVVMKWLAFALTLGALILLARRSSERERRAGLMVGGLALAGLILSLLPLVVGSDTLLTRNLLPLWLPAAMFVGSGFAVTRSRALGITGAVLLCAIGLFAWVGVDADYNLQKPNWVPFANALGQWPGTQSQSVLALASGARLADGVGRMIVIQRNKPMMPLALYLPGLHYVKGTRWPDVKEIDFVAISSPPSGGLCWWGAACNMVKSNEQADYPVANFTGEPLIRVEQFSIRRDIAATPQLMTKAKLHAALRWTKLKHDAVLIQRS